MKERNVIDAASSVGKEITNSLAALTVLLELPFGTNNPSLIPMPAATKGFDGNGFAIETIEFRLVIKRVDVRWTAVHEKKDNSFRFRSEVRPFGHERIGKIGEAILG
jgi:hypothetical protein